MSEPFLCATIGIFSNPQPNTATLAARRSPTPADDQSAVSFSILLEDSWVSHRYIGLVLAEWMTAYTPKPRWMSKWRLFALVHNIGKAHKYGMAH